MRHIALDWLLGVDLTADFNFNFYWELRCHALGNFGDRKAFLTSHVIGAQRLSLEQDCPQPDRQVGGVEIGALRGAVAIDDDWTSVHCVADEVANGKMSVQR